MALLEAAMGLLTFGAYRAKAKRDAAQAVSPQRMAEHAIIYETALNHCKDPDKLRELSVAFGKLGYKTESEMLLKRAILRELPPEMKAARRAVFDKAMASKNPAAIRAVADQFELSGATGAANDLREYAKGVEVMLQEQPASAEQEKSDG